MKHEDKNHHVTESWWAQSMVVPWKLLFWRVVLNAEHLKKVTCPGLRANCSYDSRGGISPAAEFLVVDEDMLFISGPAIVEILHDNRPRIRYFQSSRIMPDSCLVH